MRRLLLSALSVMALASGCGAPLPVTVAAQTVPASMAEKLQAALAKVSSGKQGLVLHVESPSGGVWSGAAGHVDLERQVPMTTAMPMRVGSVTKVFTAILVMQAVEEGKWTLDAAIAPHLGGEGAGLPHLERITFRQLLNHTSGLFDYVTDQAFSTAMRTNATEPRSVGDLLAVAARNQPAFEPGAGVGYCNTSYLLLGLALEKAYGQPYAELVKARIADKVGLTSTVMPDTTALPAGSRGYFPPGWFQAPQEATAFHPSLAGAGGGLVSTAGDLARLMQGLFDGRLVQPASLEAMQQFIPARRSGEYYGLGLEAVDTEAGRAVGKMGGINGFASLAIRLPDGTLVVALANQGPGSQAGELALAALGALAKP